MASEAEAVEELAQQLFSQANLGIWAAADHSTQLHFRREAARKLQEAATRERA